PGEAPPTDPQALLLRAFGRNINAEIVVANPYHTHLLVAKEYGRGRVLLAGDSAHQFVPTAGYGMNTGIGDAFGLGWKLAAILQGRGGPSLLEAYISERREIGRRNREGSNTHLQTRQGIRALFETAENAGAPEEDSSQGQALRSEVSKQLKPSGNKEN